VARLEQDLDWLLLADSDELQVSTQFLPIALTSQLVVKRPLPSGERRLAIPRRCRVLRPTHDPRLPRPHL